MVDQMDRRVDKDDVAAILMARAETLIKNHISTCAAQDKKLHGQLAEAQKELDTQLQQDAVNAAAKPLKLLQEAATELGCKHIADTVSHGYADAAKGMLSYRLALRGHKPSISWTVDADVKVSAVVKAALKVLKDMGKQVADNNNTWLDWRRKLQDLPSMERRARAAVASERLKGSDEGQRILATLEAQLDDGIKLLGVS